MTLTIDLNADLGELPGPEGRASDAAILAAITSCAIACGGHAGDEAIMTATLKAASAHNVEAGAHPSYLDRENFGRRSVAMTADALHAEICNQLNMLARIAADTGVPLTHVKPHGALYNDAARSDAIAQTVAKAVKSCFGTELALIGQPDSEIQRAAAELSLPFHEEGFMDRTYLPSGALMPRSEPGAVLEDTPARIAQARSIVLTQSVTHSQGATMPLHVQTLCLHGDSPGAADTAKAVRAALEADGVILRSAGQG